MCRNESGHLWNSSIAVPSKVIECDWCVSCGMARPGFMDPRDKWKETNEAPDLLPAECGTVADQPGVLVDRPRGALDATETEALQGLPPGKQETGAEARTKVRQSPP